MQKMLSIKAKSSAKGFVVIVQNCKGKRYCADRRITVKNLAI